MAWFRKKKRPSVEVVVKAPEKPVIPPRPEPKIVKVTLYNFVVILYNGVEITIEESFTPGAGTWNNTDTWMIFATPVSFRWYLDRYEPGCGWARAQGENREIIRIKTGDILIIKTVGTVEKEVECR